MKEKKEEKEKNIVPEIKNETKLDKNNPEALSKAISGIKIPHTNIIPAPMKVMCIQVMLENLKTSSGLILPTSYSSGNKKDDKKFLSRFFVVAIGDKVKEWTFNGKSIDIGDELLYHDVIDAVGVEHPIVTDYDLLDRKGILKEYVVLDITEFAGIIKHKELNP